MELTFGIVSAWAYGWIVTVVLFTFIHFFFIEVRKDRPVYWHWAGIRLFFCVMYFLPFQLLTWEEYIPLVVFQATTHFVIFNPLLNKLRDIKWKEQTNGAPSRPRYPFWYLGKKSGWIDKLLIRHGLTFYKFFYFACVGVMAISLVVIYIRYA